jgi:hypothetical protein
MSDSTQSPFEGFCEIEMISSAHFIVAEDEAEPSSFRIFFYKRDSEETSFDDFLESIKINNFGWNEVTKELFFKSESNEIYRVNFNPI